MTPRTKALFLLVAVIALGAAGVLWWRAQVATAPTPANAPSAIVAAPTAAPTTSSVPVSSPPASSPIAALPPAATTPTIANPPTPASDTPSPSGAATTQTSPKATPPPDAASTDRTTQALTQRLTIGNPPPRIDEVAGTERMVEAHAVLRQPEVVNPDSTGNRQILQTMLSKALLRANGADAPPTIAPK